MYLYIYIYSACKPRITIPFYHFLRNIIRKQQVFKKNNNMIRDNTVI